MQCHSILVVLQNKGTLALPPDALYKKKCYFFTAVNLALPFFQLPLLSGCLRGLQYLSVDIKITANPISASGIALRLLLLTHRKSTCKNKFLSSGSKLKRQTSTYMSRYKMLITHCYCTTAMRRA